MILGQWFYRPEEAEKKGGGNWQSSDTRELFYSFHRDEVPAESVMHRCVVYFVPAHKQLPKRKVNPGFIVRKVYDTVEKKLWKLTDKDYEDTKQHEIDLLVEGESEETELLWEGRTSLHAPEIDGKVFINDFGPHKTLVPGTFYRAEITESHDYDVVARIIE